MASIAILWGLTVQIPILGRLGTSQRTFMLLMREKAHRPLNLLMNSKAAPLILGVAR
jgi:hypothetical protein